MDYGVDVDMQKAVTLQHNVKQRYAPQNVRTLLIFAKHQCQFDTGFLHLLSDTIQGLFRQEFKALDPQPINMSYYKSSQFFYQE